MLAKLPTRLPLRAGERRTLSALIICCNEADRIEDCLRSLHGWVDEIIVFDSGSTDGTLDIVRRYTDKIWKTDWPGYWPQRNRALQQASGDWVLYIDADERVTPELRQEIDNALIDPHLDTTLFRIPWRTYLFDGELRHGRYATPQNRLFKRQGARFRDHQVHEQIVLPERRAAVMKAKLEHRSWRDYAHLQRKHRRYANLLARQKFEEGARGSIPYACMRFVTDFVQQYVLRLSVLDGWRGLMISAVLAQYAYWKYADLKALEREAARTAAPAANKTLAPVSAALLRR